VQPFATQQWQTSSPEETYALGSSFGRQAAVGDFVACCGPLGAGKTLFVQGFAQGLGVGDEAYVRSPTFTLVHMYKARIPLFHFDFYRLSTATEVQDMGFEEYVHTPGVVMVEWAEKFPELLPASRLDIRIHILSTEKRGIEALVYNPAYARYLCLT
jgi:tRNA threonylcarbamoyladenosine biosynthesis protein TsaE